MGARRQLKYAVLAIASILLSAGGGFASDENNPSAQQPEVSIHPRIKPPAAKGKYLSKVYVAATMSPAVPVTLE
jgi:hypothetical protein